MTTAGRNGGENSRNPRTRSERSRLAEFVHGKLSPEESLRALDQIEGDPELSKDLDLAILLTQKGVWDGGWASARYPRAGETGRSVRESLSLPMRMLRVAAVVLLLLGGGWFLDSSTAPPFTEIARVGIPDLHLRVRAGSSDVLEGARAYLYQGDWKECARRADWYLSVYPLGDARTTARVLRSAAMLMGARSHVLGFHVRYDPSLVEGALRSLREAREGEHTLLEAEEIDWFEAKASLMRGDSVRARQCLEAIVGRGGARVGDAHAILSQLAAPQP